MLSRLMDLVVLVAELSQNSDKSFKDLDKELSLRGYSPEEIDQAVFWYSSRGESVSGTGLWNDDGVPVEEVVPSGVPEAERFETSGSKSVRVLSEWERVSLCTECYGFLLRLLDLGIIDGEQFEKIISRSIPVGPEKIQLNDVKAIACSIIFNREPHEFEEELLDHFDEDTPTT